jgi:hypothetical protein
MANFSFAKQALELQDRYPEFDQYVEKADSVDIIGAVKLIDPQKGFVWESYEVKIELRAGFPTVLPKTYVLSKNVPWTYDRHIGNNGGCCIAPEAEEYCILGRDYSLVTYVEKLVIPFLASQKLFDLEGCWPHGDYSHFTSGLVSYYKQKLGLDSLEKVIFALSIAVGKSRLGRNDPCFCGSGQKLKKCHLPPIEGMWLIPRFVIQANLDEISGEIGVLR